MDGIQDHCSLHKRVTFYTRSYICDYHRCTLRSFPDMMKLKSGSIWHYARNMPWGWSPRMLLWSNKQSVNPRCLWLPDSNIVTALYHINKLFPGTTSRLQLITDWLVALPPGTVTTGSVHYSVLLGWWNLARKWAILKLALLRPYCIVKLFWNATVGAQ